jgi:phenylacetic acid degradation operon negative regulatory protein
VAQESLRPRAGSSAKALLLTVLGEFVLPTGGSAWTQTLVGAMAGLDVDPRNARQAIGRLAEQGIVAAKRHGRRSRWSLTADGERLLVDGTRRIYAFGAAPEVWDDRWLLVVYSVPAAERARRDQLRSQLAFAGFGFLGAGVAISPHLDREPAVNDVLRGLDLVDSSLVVRAEAGDLVPPRELVRRAWDLQSLAGEYRSFLARFDEARPARADAQFAAVVGLVHEWRRFPFLDAEIPAELLPADWPAPRAKALFDERHGAWSPAARSHFAELERGADSDGG